MARVVRRWTALVVLAAVAACSSEDDDTAPSTPTPTPTVAGAQVHVTMKSRVGVLLDELPGAERERVADILLAKPATFFVDRARRQLSLATYRLLFRAPFYDEADAKMQLPLPPDEVLTVSIVPDDTGALARRQDVEGHDYVLADYTLDAMLVTDEASPGMSEPALASVGGTWDEPFIFPVDPELLVQRTGYACMDEAEFPPNSVDTEDVEFFYDQECDVEDELTPDGCHYTELPDESCEDALASHVGKVAPKLHFERVAWDASLAKQARVGRVEDPTGADLDTVGEELAVNRVTYRYIADDSCALAEGCVGGPGWRRLLQFNASEKNVGAEAVNIGDVDYFVDDPNNPTPNANHHIYEYSACHHHYHFNYFATFTYGGDPDLGSKRAFCLESVNRYANHEQSPLWSPYSDCSYQGITPGWGDQYNAGIECQWVDVTSVDTSTGPVTEPLGLRSNPEGFLCEGTPVLGDDGNTLWEPTSELTASGQTVDRPECDRKPGWDKNNYDQRDVTLPILGEGMLTSACTRGQLGPHRNCGFAYEQRVRDCEPGATVSLRCTAADSSASAVVRVCEASAVLGAGLACMDADALAFTNLGAGESASVSFRCPKSRDATEPGGGFALYSGALFPEDGAPALECALE